MKVTACLLSWNRQYHIPEIVENLRKFSEIDEIVVWQNELSPIQELVDLDVRLICSGENIYTIGRFRAAKLAKNDIIFTQDDDLLVHNVDQLLENIESDPNTIYANLADDSSSKHWNWWQVHNPAYVELGFGSVFNKGMVDILDKWTGDQYVLNRKADKVFTFMNKWEAVYAGPSAITRLYHNGKESGRDSNSLSLRDDHGLLTEEATKLAKEWKGS